MACVTGRKVPVVKQNISGLFYGPSHNQHSSRREIIKNKKKRTHTHTRTQAGFPLTLRHIHLFPSRDPYKVCVGRGACSAAALRHPHLFPFPLLSGNRF